MLAQSFAGLPYTKSGRLIRIVSLSAVVTNLPRRSFALRLTYVAKPCRIVSQTMLGFSLRGQWRQNDSYTATAKRRGRRKYLTTGKSVSGEEYEMGMPREETAVARDSGAAAGRISGSAWTACTAKLWQTLMRNEV
jgi:hypothetical protein